MKKKALKKRVRGLEADLYASQEQGAVERREAEVSLREAALARKQGMARIAQLEALCAQTTPVLEALREAALARKQGMARIAQLEALCAQTTPGLEAASARIAQSDAVLVERAKHVEAAGEALRERLVRFGESAPEKPGFVLYEKTLLDDALRAFDAAVAHEEKHNGALAAGDVVTDMRSNHVEPR